MQILICAEALDGLRQLADESCDMCVTSPPYFRLRNYGIDGQVGLESTPEEYIAKLVDIFREVKRVLKPDGTLWVVIGDSYAGSNKGQTKNLGANDAKRAKIAGMILPTDHGYEYKPKDLIGIPWMLSFALRSDGWYLRQDIIWQKTNCMPESVKDRCTRAHEYVFMFTKSAKYYYNNDAIKETAVNGNPCSPYGSRGTFNKNSGRRKQDKCGRRYEGFNQRYTPVTVRNKRSVWSVPTKPLKEAHFAVFPPDLIRPCILAGSRVGGIVLDPFIGSGTTAIVALQEQREYVGIDLNPEYIALAEKRLKSATALSEETWK